MTEFGPGTLTIGEVAAPIDLSCLVNSFSIDMSKDQADDKTMLCGNVVPGKITYTYAATGNIDLDLEDPDGLVYLSWANPGTQVPFTFTPNTEAGATVEGTLVLDPISIGGDEYGATMNADVEWSCIGKPVITPGAGGGAARSPFGQRVQDGRRAPVRYDEPVAPPAKAKAKAKVSA